MDSLRELAIGSFYRGLGHIAVALRLPGVCLACYTGTTEEFKAERNAWLEKSSRNSILAEFTKCILQHKPSGAPAVFSSGEAANLKRVFAAHANQNSFWDQESLESYLLTQLPDDEKCRARLASCAPSLWNLVTYFSQWPFTSTAPSATCLSFHDLARATAFLSGRHSIMFSYYSEEPLGAVRRCRTDRLVLEHMFRALATETDQESTVSSFSSSHTLHDDVLDTLNAVQPVQDHMCTTRLTREQLVPLATQLVGLSDASAPEKLPNLAITAPVPDGILALLDVSILLLQHVSKFDQTQIPAALRKDLEIARTALENVDSISFDSFMKWLARDTELNVYDSVALLFNTLVNPDSLTEGITLNRDSKDRETLFVWLLRRPGTRFLWS